LIEELGDDAMILQIAKTRLLLLMATGQVDATQMARHELAQRGLDEHGAWIGFDASAKLWQAPTAAPATTQADGPDDATLDAGMEGLAQVHLGIETLTERKMDALDFHEVGVWQVKDALRAAFELGRANR
jgi:hypothetical protein